MADQRTTSDLAAVADRMTVPPTDAAQVRMLPDAAQVRRPPVSDCPSPACLGAANPGSSHEHVAAIMLAEHVAAGDDGAVLRLVNALEHQRGPWVVDPWRLAEHVALLAIRHQQATG